MSRLHRFFTARTLSGFLLTLNATAITIAICVYVLRGEADTATIGALTGALSVLVASGAVALFARSTRPQPDPKDPKAPEA